MDETTIAEMRARATAAKERIDAVEEGEVDEPEFDEVVTAAAMFANDAAKLAEDVDALTAEVERLTRERDAYRKAKVENDERFMLERDEARNERDAARDECFGLFATVNTLNRNAKESLTKLEALTQERDAALLKAQILEDSAAGWQTENATLRAEIDRLRDPALLTNLEQWDILPGGTYAPAFRDRMERVGAMMRDTGNDIAGLRQERAALTAKLASIEPVVEALLCADRQELPRDLADRVTAYVKALPCPAVTS